MQSDTEHVTEMVRNGEYYEEARRWYRAIYIGPVSERAFFAVIAASAILVSALAVIAILSFLPTTERRPVLISNSRIDETRPRITALHPKETSLNAALMHFFVSKYVESREGYSAQHYDENYRFVLAQSDPATGREYVGIAGRQNPQSNAALLQDTGRRSIAVDSLSIGGSSDPKQATVRFTASTISGGMETQTHWIATLQFYYTDLVVKEIGSPSMGKVEMQTQDPQFQVVSYVVKQAN